MTGPPDVHFSQEYVVRKPTVQDAYLIQESEWARVKRMIGGIAPQQNWLQLLGAVFLGLGLSSVLSLVAFLATRDTPAWCVPTCTAILIGSVVIGAAMLALDRVHVRSVAASAAQVIAEMEMIEKCLMKEMGAEETDKAPWIPALSAGFVGLGDEVDHATFGRGRIEAFPGKSAGGNAVWVRFAEGRRRVFMADLKKRQWGSVG